MLASSPCVLPPAAGRISDAADVASHSGQHMPVMLLRHQLLLPLLLAFLLHLLLLLLLV
jgi:hypothetical protein